MKFAENQVSAPLHVYRIDVDAFRPGIGFIGTTAQKSILLDSLEANKSTERTFTKHRSP